MTKKSKSTLEAWRWQVPKVLVDYQDSPDLEATFVPPQHSRSGYVLLDSQWDTIEIPLEDLASFHKALSDLMKLLKETT